MFDNISLSIKMEFQQSVKTLFKLSIFCTKKIFIAEKCNVTINYILGKVKNML